MSRVFRDPEVGFLSGAKLFSSPQEMASGVGVFLYYASSDVRKLNDRKNLSRMRENLFFTLYARDSSQIRV